eukprot:5775537-Prymnesium_polylepis.1
MSVSMHLVSAFKVKPCGEPRDTRRATPTLRPRYTCALCSRCSMLQPRSPRLPKPCPHAFNVRLFACRQRHTPQHICALAKEIRGARRHGRRSLLSAV